MGLLYSATFDAQTVSTATDLFEIAVGAARNFYPVALELLQTSDLQDAAEEVLRIGIYRGVTAGATGTAATENAYNHSDNPTADCAVTTLRGTASTGGTLLHIIGWNIRIPTLWVPTPEMKMRFDDAEDPVSFRLIAAPTDAITMSATLVWEEA